MTSLGEKLKAANEKRQAMANDAERRKREADALKFKQDEEQIEGFLNKCQTHWELEIKEDVLPSTFTVPRSSPFDTYSWPSKKMVGKFEATNHPHQVSFDRAFKWADDNGLVLTLNYCHDGGGMASWFTASVDSK